MGQRGDDELTRRIHPSSARKPISLLISSSAHQPPRQLVSPSARSSALWPFTCLVINHLVDLFDFPSPRPPDPGVPWWPGMGRPLPAAPPFYWELVRWQHFRSFSSVAPPPVPPARRRACRSPPPWSGSPRGSR